jgi:hypothetical protein
LHGPYPQNISNPFGGPPSFQHFPFPPPAYHGGYYDNGPASPIRSMAFFGPSGGNNSRGDESSPIASSSSASRAPPMESIPIHIEEDSEQHRWWCKARRLQTLAWRGEPTPSKCLAQEFKWSNRWQWKALRPLLEGNCSWI